MYSVSYYVPPSGTNSNKYWVVVVCCCFFVTISYPVAYFELSLTPNSSLSVNLNLYFLIYFVLYIPGPLYAVPPLSLPPLVNLKRSPTSVEHIASLERGLGQTHSLISNPTNVKPGKSSREVSVRSQMRCPILKICCCPYNR